VNRDMLDILHSLPEDKQREIMDCVYMALKWRGWDQSTHSLGPAFSAHAVEQISNIGAILESAGISVEEYT
jgi:hypothetical protein